ncbi:unnamed protein product [Kluyveromyces dobzhanskii CBS 2104]|uniref:WGS project CCBQ000000000 data, contig 00058 n=1 Tax=Kluyveromyces dobzhanskii CBS 2104 TaxID=1427455 RepID=A0A0A8LDM6_9SACH|nr:unnamed protein product [Kluyveromyces dobzhanskii CBS 2104]
MFGRSSSIGPPAGGNTTGGLFGSGNTQSGQNTGGLFGNSGGSQQNAGGGLFGKSTGTTGGGLFGSSNAPSGNTGGSLFGNNNTTGNSNTAQTGGGLFGGNQAGTNANTNTTTGGLFGNSNSNTMSGANTGGLFGTSGSATTGGLFGNKPAQAGGTGFGGPSTGGLFGSKPTTGGLFSNSQQPQQQQQPSAGGLFSSQQQPSTGGLFSNQQQPSTGGLFSNQQQQQQQSTTGGLFSNQQQSQLQTQQPQQSAINFINQLAITPMTKISELPIQIRQEIEQLDQFISTQVSLSKHLQADLNDQTELLDSIPRDIKYLQKLHFNATRSLSADSKKIDAIKTLVDDDVKQLENFAIMLQQLVTKGFKISNVEIDKFFQEKLITYKNKLNDYNDTLSNIDDAVSGLENDLFGNDSSEDDETKIGVNIIVSVLIEEFKLFMDTAERIAELHQKCKELVLK